MLWVGWVPGKGCVVSHVRVYACVATPGRVWLLLFIPSFIRYMMLLRGSLRPRPLHVGEVQ